MNIIQPKICPCCGQTLQIVDFWGLTLTRAERLIVTAVTKRGAHGVTRELLLDDVYGADTGMRMSRSRSLDVTKWRLNKKLTTVGREIVYDRQSLRFKLIDWRRRVNEDTVVGCIQGHSQGPR